MGLAQQDHKELDTSTAATSLEQGPMAARAEMGPWAGWSQVRLIRATEACGCPQSHDTLLNTIIQHHTDLTTADTAGVKFGARLRCRSSKDTLPFKMRLPKVSQGCIPIHTVLPSTKCPQPYDGEQLQILLPHPNPPVAAFTPVLSLPALENGASTEIPLHCRL